MRASAAGLSFAASDEAFAAAMLKCQSPSGACCYSGECAYDGECFRSDTAARREALRRLDALAAECPPDIASWINSARTALASERKP